MVTSWIHGEVLNADVQSVVLKSEVATGMEGFPPNDLRKALNSQLAIGHLKS